MYPELKREYSDEVDDQGLWYIMPHSVVQMHFLRLQAEDYDDTVQIVGFTASVIVKVEDSYVSADDSILCVGDSLASLSKGAQDGKKSKKPQVGRLSRGSRLQDREKKKSVLALKKSSAKVKADAKKDGKLDGKSTRKEDEGKP